MKIEIPDHLDKEFLQFLDIAQTFYTNEDITRMSPNEKDVIKLVEDLIGEDRCDRFENKAAMKAAVDKVSTGLLTLLK